MTKTTADLRNIERRTACPFDMPNGVAVADQTTFDRLHNLAGVMAFIAQHTEGIGGLTTDDPDNPDELLHTAVRAVKVAADALDLAVDTARDHGMSWQKIGDLLGISRQAAWERFGKVPNRPKLCDDCGHPAPHEPGGCEYFTAPKTKFPGSIEPCDCGK